MTAKEFTTLLSKWKSGAISDAEAGHFMSAVKGGEFDELLQDTMTVDFESEWFNEGVSEGLKAKDWSWIRENRKTAKVSVVAHRVHFLKTAWFRYAAAVIILSGVGAYLWNMNKPVPGNNTVAVKPYSNDVQPGRHKAILTLADGRQILLDSVKNGQLAVENGNMIVKRGEEVVYGNDRAQSDEVVYNTMSTPKGGQYQLTLHDGTRVWLNAGSSLTYPTVFAGSERKVELSGEAYFEVAKKAAMPFKVKVNNVEVKVLGTHFNIHGYSDENAIRTTLLEGSVKVSINGKEKLLSPGQQSIVSGNFIQTDDNVNISCVVAWKDGLFLFENKDVESIMKELARWYDVEIEYRGAKVTELFTATISRESTLSKVLSFLEKTGRIHFSLKGKKVIVTL